MDQSFLKELLAITVKHLGALLAFVALCCGLVLFLPSNVLDILFLSDIKARYGFAIGPVFFVSSVGFIIWCLRWTILPFSNKIRMKRVQAERTQYLKGLPQAHCDLIYNFLYSSNNTLSLPMNDGRVVELAAKRVISPAGKTQMLKCGASGVKLNYFLQPWVRYCIYEDPDLRRFYGMDGEDDDA